MTDCHSDTLVLLTPSFRQTSDRDDRASVREPDWTVHQVTYKGRGQSFLTTARRQMFSHVAAV